MVSGAQTTVQAPGGLAKLPLSSTSGAHERVEHKRDLASWWRNFKRSDKKVEQQGTSPRTFAERHVREHLIIRADIVTQQGIFGVPLHISIRYANVAISLYNDEGQSYIYGYVPIVVAKCGVFLKEKATDVEGIFRLAGSEKRIKELKVAFDSPERYGKGLDWTGYTVHDAANILRRYFNQLPEPIIPLDFYERFRQPLHAHQTQANPRADSQNQVAVQPALEDIIRAYQALITELPPLNRQLLLYILDLLAVFASKSDFNKMTTPNLAAIFQPGTLSHPQHDMAPQEYRLSQDVLIFLIENQDSFLIGMHGTAADAETVRDVQGGTPVRTTPTPATPTRPRTLLARSGSNASAGAESVRKWGSIRRNVSVSSKKSQFSQGVPVPGGPSAPSTPTTGVQRSNTVPSRRVTASPRIPTDKSIEPRVPLSAGVPRIETSVPAAYDSSLTTPTAVILPRDQIPRPGSVTSSEATTPLAAPVASDASSTATQVPNPDKTPLLKTTDVEKARATGKSDSVSPTASTSHGGFLGIFGKSPASDGETRKPNKLQKRRVPGSALSSAHSSSHSLGNESEHRALSVHRAPDTIVENAAENVVPTQSVAIPATSQRSTTDATIRPTTSPTRSYTSHTDTSDADMAGDDMPANPGDQVDREKKRHRWRFSRSQNKVDAPVITSPSNALGMTSGREHAKSFSTIGSSQPRKSLQESSRAGVPDVDGATTSVHPYNADVVFSDSEREKKGPMSWIRNKLQERKEMKEADKQGRAPDRKAVDKAQVGESDARQSTQVDDAARLVAEERAEQTLNMSTALDQSSLPLDQPSGAPALDADAPLQAVDPGEAMGQPESDKEYAMSSVPVATSDKSG